VTDAGEDRRTRSGGERVPAGVDATRPSIARVYDHLLGGEDNFAADRAVGEQIKAALPEVHLGVRACSSTTSSRPVRPVRRPPRPRCARASAVASSVPRTRSVT
jgi:hypothetical protein